MKIIIPSIIIDKIETGIDNDIRFIRINPKQKKRLIEELTNLYYYIYTNINYKDIEYFQNISKKSLQSITRKLTINKNRLEYKNYLDILVDCEIIYINDCYNPKEFSKGYRINSKLLSYINTREIDIDIDKMFNNNKSKEYWNTQLPLYSELINKIYNIDINLNEVVEYLYNNKGMKLKPKAKKLSNGKTIIVDRYLNEITINRYINTLLKFKTKNLWFSISDEGRFYNSLTNLPSIIRPFLKVNGRYLVEVDIVASQPTILTSIIKCEEFKNDIQIGRFYETILEELNPGYKNFTKLEYEIERSKIKTLLYSKIMFNKRQLKSGDLFDTLNKYYPEFVSQVNKLKKDGGVAIRLHKLESNVMVDKISFLRNVYATIHDSALIFIEDKPQISKQIEREFKKQLNINIKLK